MVVGLAPRVGKLVHPCRVLIYCNSHALGYGNAPVTRLDVEFRKSLCKIELMLHDDYLTLYWCLLRESSRYVFCLFT